MCGIVGFNWPDESLIDSLSDTLVHRGPDGGGTYVDDAVSLGHRRLSIIDLSDHGRQPMTNEDGSIWVTFNGEIYNFRELRNRLEAKGHTFRSRTDTEVIVHGYEEYGADCVQHFNGMFAFAVWDKRRRELLLVRDRLGVKPLYYYYNDHKLVFASEIKTILQLPELALEVNPQSLYHYLGFEFVPAPATIFRHVYKLPPGHFLRLRDGKVEVRQYWDIDFGPDDPSPGDYEERLRQELTESVQKRLVSDVPLGVFLSGGLDSSTVVALMSRSGVEPLQTFALGYDDPTFSELEYARIVSRHFHTEHHELIIDPVTPELIDDVVWQLDEPMTDLSAIPFYLICQKAREHVTVCLSGEGGDEVLAGYDRFKASKLHHGYQSLPAWLRRGVVAPLVGALPDAPQKKGPANLLKRFIEGGLLDAEGGHLRWSFFGRPEYEAALYRRDFLAQVSTDSFAPLRPHLARCNSPVRLEREIYVDLKFAMPDSVLMKVDKMSMAHGLEVRVPFLDYQFVEFGATIPANLKLSGLTTKAILRNAVAPLLPPEILSRGKQGCGAPIKNWLRQELRGYLLDSLSASPLVADAFNMDYINRLVREHDTHRANHSHLLWALLNLAVWHRLFVESPRQLPGRSVAA